MYLKKKKKKDSTILNTKCIKSSTSTIFIAYNKSMQSELIVFCILRVYQTDRVPHLSKELTDRGILSTGH